MPITSIEIVNLSTGIIERRRGNTPTLDIPQDLDLATGGVSVDTSSLGYYFAAGGRRLVYAAMPTLLSMRPPGAECLVADEPANHNGESCFRRYRLSAVERRS
jgi:hypothetical protein